MRKINLTNHRLLYKWTVHEKSPLSQLTTNTLKNKSKLIDLMMRIGLTS